MTNFRFMKAFVIKSYIIEKLKLNYFDKIVNRFKHKQQQKLHIVFVVVVFFVVRVDRRKHRKICKSRV